MVTQEMVIVRIEDIAAYAEARGLLRGADARLAAAGGAAAGSGLVGLRLTAAALCVAVAEALRAATSREEVRRLRDASMALADLRARIWTTFAEAELDPAGFDELMAAASRCRIEVDRWEAHVRHRARRQIDFGE
jgi:hypothetical protein